MRPNAPPGSLLELALGQLRSLERALGMQATVEGPPEDPRARVFAEMIAPAGWPLRPASGARLPSGISHRFPFGFSMVAGAGEPELRALIEPQSAPPSASGYWRAGQAVSAFIARQPGASLERLRAVEPLFEPTWPEAPFRVWHGVSFFQRRPPAFKIYLCAAAQGHTGARARLCEALGRLGFGRAAAPLAGRLRGETDAFTILSLDHAPAPAGRVKVYLLQRGAGPRELEAASLLARGARAGDAALFARAMLGEVNHEARIWWLSCFSYRDPRDDLPEASALHLGVPRHLPDDEVASQRIRALLGALGLSDAPYRRALAELAPGSLEGRRGLHHFVSFQRRDGAPRVTVYFAPSFAPP